MSTQPTSTDQPQTPRSIQYRNGEPKTRKVGRRKPRNRFEMSPALRAICAQGYEDRLRMEHRVRCGGGYRIIRKTVSEG